MTKLKSLAVIALALIIGGCSSNSADRSDGSDKSDGSMVSADGRVITADLRFSATAYDDAVADVRTALMQAYPELRELITDSRPSYGVLLVTQEKSADAVSQIIDKARADGLIPDRYRVAPEYSASNSDGVVRYKSYYLINDPADFVPAEPVTATEEIQDGHTAINLQFTGEDIDSWTNITQRHIGQPLAIIVNGRVISAPFIQDVITGGKAMVTGLFDHELYETMTKTGRKTAVK